MQKSGYRSWLVILGLGLGWAIGCVPMCQGQESYPSWQTKAPPLTASPRPDPGAPPQLIGPPTRTIRAAVNLVDIPVLVLNKRGNAVLGLQAGNFMVKDDGHAQKLVAFDNEARPVSIAIIIDTTEYAAVEQAKRAALLLANMVVGAKGRAAIFVAGDHTREILSFTGRKRAIIETLRSLKVGPKGNDITEGLALAVLRISHQPIARQRAILVISRQNPSGNEYAKAIVQASMGNATPVFRIKPNRYKARRENPYSPSEHGTGPGSSRAIHPASPIGRNGAPEPCSSCNANFGPSIELAAKGAKAGVMTILGHFIKLHGWSYAYATGGLSYDAGSNRGFDRKLARIGNALRAFYQLYYTPVLGPVAEVHLVKVKVYGAGKVRQIAYRHTYVGVPGA